MVPMHHHMSIFFFFNDPATPELYPLPLHDALPILSTVQSDDPVEIDEPLPLYSRLANVRPAIDSARLVLRRYRLPWTNTTIEAGCGSANGFRSEEHTSELQSQSNLVCRLLLEKKK